MNNDFNATREARRVQRERKITRLSNFTLATILGIAWVCELAVVVRLLSRIPDEGPWTAALLLVTSLLILIGASILVAIGIAGMRRD